MIDTDLAQSRRKGALGLRHRRQHDVADQSTAREVITIAFVDRSGGAENFSGSNVLRVAAELVAAAWAAHPAQDAVMDQCLQDRLEMAWWQPMPIGKGLG